jgi:hypothetical protein
MNAVEKAISLGFVSKIATIVNLFQSQFAHAVADLSPWLDDPMTRATIDPDSIDLCFHFPRHNSTKSPYTMLLQIRLQSDVGNNDPLLETRRDRVLGLEISSHSWCGCLWEFSTVGDWQFCNSTGLSPEYKAQIKSFCRDVLSIFDRAEYSHHQS